MSTGVQRPLLMYTLIFSMAMSVASDFPTYIPASFSSPSLLRSPHIDYRVQASTGRKIRSLLPSVSPTTLHTRTVGLT